jgi:hypothetical protein
MNNEPPNKLIASHTSIVGKTLHLWDMNGIIKIVEGQTTMRGWSHRKTTVYANWSTAKAAFTKRTGVVLSVSLVAFNAAQ